MGKTIDEKKSRAIWHRDYQFTTIMEMVDQNKQIVISIYKNILYFLIGFKKMSRTRLAKHLESKSLLL